MEADMVGVMGEYGGAVGEGGLLFGETSSFAGEEAEGTSTVGML